MTDRTPADLVALRDLAVRLARRAATIHREGRERAFEVHEKSSATDFVTEIDRAAEREIVAGIVAERPGDAILGEEGTDRDGTTGVRWIVDPLDGTSNYVRGYPGYCAAIGIEVDGEPTIGVVVDSSGACTEGILGLGATRDGRPIRPSTRADLASSLIATGFAYRSEQRAEQAAVVARILPRIADVRRSGSASFDLVSTACGTVEGYYEIGLGPWDLCAGRAIVDAAGGAVGTFVQPDERELVVAAPTQLFDPLIALLSEAGLTTLDGSPGAARRGGG